MKNASFLVRIGKDQLALLDAALPPEFRNRAELVERFVDGFCQDPAGVMAGLILIIGVPPPKPTRGSSFLYWLDSEELERFNAALRSLYHRRQEVFDAFIAALLIDKRGVLKLLPTNEQPAEE